MIDRLMHRQNTVHVRTHLRRGLAHTTHRLQSTQLPPFFHLRCAHTVHVRTHLRRGLGARAANRLQSTQAAARSISDAPEMKRTGREISRAAACRAIVLQASLQGRGGCALRARKYSRHPRKYTRTSGVITEVLQLHVINFHVAKCGNKYGKFVATCARSKTSGNMYVICGTHVETPRLSRPSLEAGKLNSVLRLRRERPAEARRVGHQPEAWALAAAQLI